MKDIKNTRKAIKSNYLPSRGILTKKFKKTMSALIDIPDRILLRLRPEVAETNKLYRSKVLCLNKDFRIWN